MATFSPTGPKAPASDFSDITSETSEDGVSALKSKKKPRVSFDEQPYEIDAAHAAAAPKAISTVEAVAQGTRALSPLSDDDIDGDMMKPRPALPSFGSVRRNRAASPEMPEKVTEMAPERDGLSSDHAIAGIIAAAHSNEPLAPEVTSKESAGYVSDESEEESSFRPDASSTPNKLLPDGAQPVQPRRVSVDELDPKVKDFATQMDKMLDPTIAGAPKLDDKGVPAISLQPPTPGDDAGKQLGVTQPSEAKPAQAEMTTTVSEEPTRRSWEGINVPGSWADDGSDEPIVAAPAAAVYSAQAEPKASASEASTAAKLAPTPALDIVDEESDDSAAFSDAAEDLSDLEDGGFASLDAIVTTPIVQQPANIVSGKPTSPPESPTAAKHTRQTSKENGDWSAATAYWSQLSRQQKEQIEREHLSDDEDGRSSPVVERPAKKKSAPKQADAVPVKARTHTPSEQHTMPRTMRAKAGPASVPASSPADGEVHMRRSMRGSSGSSAGSAGMPTTMRNGSQQRPRSEYVPTQRQAVQTRPISASGPPASKLGPNGLALPRPQNRTRTDSESSIPTRAKPANKQEPAAKPTSTASKAAPLAPSGAYTAKLQKKVTNDSDSESSFKKKRRASQSTVGSTGRYTMRRSMRAGSVDSASIDQRPGSPTKASTRGGGAFSIRSLSPAGGSVFGPSKGEKLRSTLRSGSVDGAGTRMTTLRSQAAPSARPPSRPSTAGAAAPLPKPRFKSRFIDSDDEGEDDRPKPSVFRSRFADSDDDDEQVSPPLRPVRGIPRRAGKDDGDSTDLEDEDDYDPRSQDPRRDSKRRSQQSRPIVPAPADIEKAMEAARKKLGIPAVEDRPAQEDRQGEALGRGSLRKPAEGASTSNATHSEPSAPLDTAPEKKRRGFMGSILRRNRSSQASVQQFVPNSPAPPSPTLQKTISPLPDGASPTTKAAETSAPSSPTTGRKLIRRSSAQPPFERGDSTFSTATTATAPPATSTLRHKDSTNWPLPPAVPQIPSNFIKDPIGDRPQTSDGVSVDPESLKMPRTMRQENGERRESAATQSAAGRSVGFAPGSKEEDGGAGVVYSRRTGKKKKFGMLRKAFGLYD
jgi:serine/arginine repetitive matrix protein 2